MMFSPLMDRVLNAQFLPLMGACDSAAVPGTQWHCPENAHTLKIFSGYLLYLPPKDPKFSTGIT